MIEYNIQKTNCKYKNLLQVFNMEKKEKLKAVDFPENVVFWKWANQITLAIVTATSVYHLDIFSDKPQYKVLERANELVAYIKKYFLLNKLIKELK